MNLLLFNVLLLNVMMLSLSFKKITKNVKYNDVFIRRNLSGYINFGNSEKKESNELLVLDFDGVMCASSTESSVTAIIAAERYWPDDIIVKRMNTSSDFNEFVTIRDAIGELRPIIETGYENMLLARSLFNELKSKGSLDVKTIFSKWNAEYRDSLLKV